MSGWSSLVAACLLLAAHTGAPGAQESRAEARFRCEPAEVEVGQPFDLVLVLVHPQRSDVFAVGDRELVLDDSWVSFGRTVEAPRLLLNVPQGPEPRAVTVRRWTLASLDPGERGLAEAAAALVADDRVARVDASAARVTVQGVLGAEESAPRPPRGFPEGFGEVPGAVRHPWRWWVGGLAALLWLGVLVQSLRRRRRGRRARPVVEPPAAALARLRAQPAESPDAVRARHFELTALVRRAVDERRALPSPGRTDGEWLATLQDTDPELVEDLRALLEASEAVKYGGALPTSWALEESYARVQRVIERAQRLPVAATIREGAA